MDRYIKGGELGRGKFGRVYSATDSETGKIVAVKTGSIKQAEGQSKCPSLRELSILLGLSDCPYIIKVLSHELIGNTCYIIMEYMPYDLFKFTQQFTYTEDIIQKFMYQLLKALSYAHSHGVYHRDLKPNNILVDEVTVQLKVADFNVSKQIPLPRPHVADTTKVGTLWYRPPELLVGPTSYLAAGVDMWAVGCLFAELVTKRVLFEGTNEITQIMQIFRIMGTPNGVICPGLDRLRSSFPTVSPKPLREVVDYKLDQCGTDLLSRLLDYNPEQRISAQAALDHPYFDSLDKTLYP